jgi:hypothetical protein
MRFKEAVAGQAGPILRFVPIRRWPRSLSRLTGVLTPRAVSPHAHPSAAGGANINILIELLERTANLNGDIAECGVWRGRTLIAMGLYLQQHGATTRIWGFDSFHGFDASIERDVKLGGAETHEKKVGGFSNTSYDLVQRKLNAFRLNNVRVEPGWFQVSLPRCQDRTFRFVHLDCDIYESYRTCLAFFYPRVSPGGIILFDEYNDPAWPGANQAVDEFFADKPEKPQSITRDNFQKWFVVKS